MRNNRRTNRRIQFIPDRMTNQKRVAIYCRVSTTRWSQEESLEAQKNGLEEVIKNNLEWSLFKIYTDTDSGKNIYRHGFHEMLLDSYENRFDIIWLNQLVGLIEILLIC